MKDSSIHQTWISRPGIQCLLFFSMIYMFLPFIFYFLSGCGGGAGAAWFGAALATFLIFDSPFYSLEASVSYKPLSTSFY